MAQFGRPNADISATGWAKSTGTYFYECVDETTASDVDYVRGTNSVTLELKLSSVTDPVSSAGHVVRWRGTSNGSKGPEAWTVSLYQGASLIEDLVSGGTVTRGWTDYSATLTNADAITNYADLRIRIVTSVGSGETVDVSFMEMEFPDEPAVPDALVSKNVSTPVPTVTKSVIAQVHVLVDKDVSTPVMTVTRSVIGQIHVLTSKAIITPVPTVIKSVLAEVGGEDTLTSKDISTPVPTVTKLVIGQVHVLTDKDIQTPVPTLTKVVIGQVHVLTDKDIQTVPTITKVVIGQIHVLTDKDISTPVPTVTKSALGQVHILADKDVTSGIPTVANPTLGIAEAGTDILVSKPITSGVPTISKLDILIITIVNVSVKSRGIISLTILQDRQTHFQKN